MSSLVAGTMFLALYLVVVFIGLDLGLRVQDEFGESQNITSAKDHETRNTLVSLTNGSTATPGTTVTADLTNTGAIAIELLDGIDVLVDYETASSVRQLRRLTYTAIDPPGNNEWTYTAITPDTQNPNLLDPEEVASIKVTLSPAIGSGKIGALRIATAKGGLGQTTYTW